METLECFSAMLPEYLEGVCVLLSDPHRHDQIAQVRKQKSPGGSSASVASESERA